MRSPNLIHRTKIVATIGPATQKPDVLKALIEAGATTLRLNFSHGSHEDHQRSIRLIRQVSFELNKPVGILQDLQGPKIRLGKFENGSIKLNRGDHFILTSRDLPGNEEISSVTYEPLADEVPDGATILLDDGKVEMLVEKVDRDKGELHCRVVVGGVLSNSKGVNFPGVYLSIKAMTDKDRRDLMFGLDQGVDWVALSFVRNPQDVLEIKELIASAGKDVPVIAKIEKHEAIEQMEEILALCNGVMVARGDLGVELPAEDVPLLQKRLIVTANRMGIPVITATQMLDSMVSNPRPTRAEISDVANAILDGTDAVMLSNETAVGQFPVEAVATMARIANRIERDGITRNVLKVEDTGRSIPNAISQAVSQIAIQLDAAAIMTLTKTGATARNVSKFRPQTPILAITPHVEVARQLSLVWGVKPLLVLDLPSTDQTFQSAVNVARENNFVADGDLVVTTAGTLQGVAGSTDLVKVEVVTAVLGKGTAIGQGTFTGRARVVNQPSQVGDFNPGEILVVSQTNADFVEVMRKAAGVVTEVDSLTSHAAVIGLRLGVPVIVGVKNATQVIRDGVILTLDMQRGVVYSGATASTPDPV
ncbi:MULTISPECIES: pyruvate kinase [Arthrospira]|jgi:pyruvate kinase|uniref:Pyruvate kinase n=1 Tax=Limnospira platensis NIES-46 TaxID=1236695 RepID=A0A5M3TEK1_LIMPL|nr:pyruvate kinase [Arthrospira platensis]AMW31097.1 pyruvate kinase [Arthrospira platensis YZ]KDR58602.1 pyruvate kinase [Arthrospira platensis str. Paraca]MBD2669119.1 pyruvate kinase [Arthrospira platensis FACHB-439]MBD2712354.1 pyruvate kinase [Arthrospira platensis FACHB-835]MDF2208498.1 pyruvate kinase [Arthrospira platensis NCB002]MDT9185698.1 pyruvate kinase [Limnospira sp. PMC 289.06]MDT9297909.1 pyruvate kinase [Arthrospira platensis PCC 7345]MDT9313178.1 pyruvate kinase [Limnospi